jgi:hypothetical protein
MHSAKAESRFAEQILHIFEEDMAQRSVAISHFNIWFVFEFVL